MPRQETDDPRTTISVKVDESTKEQYQDAIPGSMSQDLRAYIQSRADGETRCNVEPPTDDQTLRDAYIALLEAVDKYAEPDSARITVDRAKSEVAQATGVPKDGLKRRVFRPLEARGYLRVAGGRMAVRGGARR